jgi:curved DNA-binding protein CbpA
MVSESSDHYRVLQVDPSADVDVIQAAYRVLARRFHPDLAGDDAVMKRLNAAWEVLGDKDGRAEYDRSRANGGNQAQAPIVTSAPGMRPAASPDHAGPPKGRAFGTVLTYGRYEGWSLGQIALVDPEFLEWMRSVPGGRYLRPEIDAILREVHGPLGPNGKFASAGSSAQRMKEAGVLIG